MNCEQMNAMLDKWMDGELSTDERMAMEAHGRECPECAAAPNSTLQLKALLSQLEPEADVPLQAQAAWRGAIKAEARKQRGRRMVRWAATAAAAVAVLVGVGLTQNARLTARQDANAKMLVREDTVTSEAADAGMVAFDQAPANGAVIEADGAEEAVGVRYAQEEDIGALEELEESAAPECAAVAQSAPGSTLSICARDVDLACDRVHDLVLEYDGVVDVERLEDGSANLYVQIDGADAADFLNAVAPLDESEQPMPLPDLTGEGAMLVLLEIVPLD